MLTFDQSNFLHELMDDMQKIARKKLGMDIHFGVYMGSKQISHLISEAEAVEIMARALGVSMEDLTGLSKKPDLVMFRKVIVAVLRATFKVSLQDLARLLGRTDHSTSINLINKATDLINSNDEEFKQLFDKAKAALEEQQPR